MFQAGPSEDIWFLTERDWSQESFHANDTMGAIRLLECHLVSFVMYISSAKLGEPSFSRDIPFFSIFTILVVHLMTSPLS